MKNTLILNGLLMLSFWCNAQTADPALKSVRKTIEASNEIYADLANKKDGSILTRYTNDACLWT
jgi:hypothetical protein